MADDTRETEKTAPALGPNTISDGSKYPKGIVLGPDGKPCRSCNEKTAFSAWMSQAKKSTATTAKPAAAPPQPATDCPADVETLGRSTWTLLHSIAATYPKTPTPTQQNDLKSFMGLFAKLYPCWVCAEDFQKYIKKEEPQVRTRDEFGNWLCEAHNEVNRKLGKPVFDCKLWEQRWRTGWKDGRCD